MVTRQAALRVLEGLRPDQTVTICLPLFLAGGEGDRAFARFYPTIAVDGCEKRCAARGDRTLQQRARRRVRRGRVRGRAWAATAGRAAPPDARKPGGRRSPGRRGRCGSRSADCSPLEPDSRRAPGSETRPPKSVSTSACACGSGIPVTTVELDGRTATIMALEPILEMALQTRAARGRRPARRRSGRPRRCTTTWPRRMKHGIRRRSGWHGRRTARSAQSARAGAMS